jgi:hypothetical protein
MGEKGKNAITSVGISGRLALRSGFLALAVLALAGCTKPQGTTSTPAPAPTLTADMVVETGDEAPVKLNSSAEPGTSTLTQDKVVPQAAMGKELALALPQGLKVPESVRLALETAMIEATGASGFTLKLVEIPAEGGPVKFLEDLGNSGTSLMLVPHVEAELLASQGKLRAMSLGEFMYLAEPEAKVSREAGSAAPPAEDSGALVSSFERLPDDYFDPNRSPLATAKVAEPSQGSYAPFLHTALGLAAPGNGGSDTRDLESWSALFTAAGGLPRLVPANGAPEVYWAGLLSRRRSPNSIAANDFPPISEMIKAAAGSLVPMPEGYAVTEALGQGGAALALVYGNQLKAKAVENLSVRFAVPREGSVRRGYDLVVPINAPEERTARIFAALLWRPALTAEMARGLGMTPSLNPPARALLMEQGAPVTCLLPETRQYYLGDNSHEQRTVTVELTRELKTTLQGNAGQLPAATPASEEAPAAVAPEPAPVPAPVMEPSPTPEPAPGASSVPPAVEIPVAPTEPAPAQPAPEDSTQSAPPAPAPLTEGAIVLPGPEEMPAIEVEEPKPAS